MSVIIFAVDYSESFRRGVNCPLPPRVELEVDVAALPAADREAIAHRLDEKGIVRDRPTDPSSGGYYTCAIKRPSADLAGLLTAIRAQDAARDNYEAERTARQEEQRERDERALLAPPEQSESTIYVALTETHDVRSDSYASCSVTDKPDIVQRATAQYVRESLPYIYTDDVRARAKLIEQRLAAANDARYAAAIEQARQVMIAKDAERLAWIQQHGSQRLRRMVAEGISHQQTYLSERAKYDADELARAIAEKRPGWRLVDESDLVQEVADVSLRALAILDAARTDKVSVEPVRLGKLKSTGKYVAWQRFRDRLIVWPAE